MTTREWINKNFGKEGESKYFSSVAKDRKGNIYSYGSHYPLLFKVGGKVFRNTGGYSNSTAKHINWTYDVEAINVELRGCNQYTWNNSENSDKVPALLRDNGYYNADNDKQILKAIKADLKASQKQLKEQMQAKKRKDTQVYGWLKTQLNRVESSLAQI